MRSILRYGIVASAIVVGHALYSSEAADYADVSKVFEKRCIRCHSTEEPDGELVLETFSSLMKGGESGKVIEPGTSEKSLLVYMIEGRKGYRAMPPGRNQTRLKPDEIKLIRAWIDAGANSPNGEESK